jgi:iron(III) transport system ATP-binding protein
MPTPITLTGLTKRFAAAPPAVDAVSLSIEPGELYFLLGPSGCGKTTLLRMIAGFIEPTAGTIRFGQRDVTRLPPNKRNTGMVFQSYALWPHMTVEANVAFGLSVRKVPSGERQRRVAEALALVRMGEYAARRPNQLSGGQQQRVALARALVIRPDVLLLDEPLSNLDAKLRLELRSEIRRICKEVGATTVYVTHDQKEALSMADRVAIMRAGKVVQLGTPSDLYRRPASCFVAEFLGETNFIDGTIGGPAPPLPDGSPSLRINTDAGELVAAAPPGQSLISAGTRVVCSIRPEAIFAANITQRGGETVKFVNSIQASIEDTIYLGEVLVTTARTSGKIALRFAQLNPNSPHLALKSGEQATVTLAVDPQDIVVLSPD